MTYTIPATNLTSAERNLTNNFPLSTATSASYYEGTLGGKSGYTEASGSTLAAGASRNGTTLICVVLSGTEQQVPPEAITLLDYGFSNFQTISVTDELNTISGGTAVIPSTASADDVTVENTHYRRWHQPAVHLPWNSCGNCRRGRGGRLPWSQRRYPSLQSERGSAIPASIRADLWRRNRFVRTSGIPDAKSHKIIVYEDFASSIIQDRNKRK